jgi:hypothetical protein
VSRSTTYAGPLTAVLRECWYLARNLRCSCEVRAWTVSRPTVHAIVVESVHVDESHRREGHCRRFLEGLCADERFEMVVVEAVQNEHLATALLRWGWEYDPAISDYYWKKGEPLPRA